MDTTLRPGLGTMARPGRLLIAATLLLAFVGLLIVTVGSRQQRLPEPFGLAHNGSFVTSTDGDIYRLEPSTGALIPLVAAEQFDFGPVFSRDGTRFMFLRSAEEPGDPAVLTLMVANADGSGIHEVTPPMRSLDWIDWSPDGTRIAFNSEGVLYVVDAAGGDPSRLPLDDPIHFVTWLPPDGSRLVFRSEGFRPALFGIHPDGSGLEQITPDGTSRTDYESLAISPDGTRFSYSRRIGLLPQIFLYDVAAGTETRLPNGDGSAQIGIAPFSPDGSKIAYTRRYVGGEYQVIVAPSDGTSDGQTVGPRMPAPAADEGINVWTIFAPDGASLLVRYGGDESGATHQLPLDGSPGRTIVATGAFQFVDVQRLRR